ncbi:hypothetical protein SAMN04488012_1048 [Palleronia salina]|uniref:Uncharacterized protein n=1 Tax=Palleronia salina TaxID=313368 RepID=A0A1M6FMJ3_9RHOB|nr:hypothetical protein [Palleronia salina]SHI98907.1 hypothetical protein SAMN04488012_1048 [Palleronia salina]
MFVHYHSQTRTDADRPATAYEAERAEILDRVDAARRRDRDDRRARRRRTLRRLVRLPLGNRRKEPKFPLATRTRRR